VKDPKEIEREHEGIRKEVEIRLKSYPKEKCKDKVRQDLTFFVALFHSRRIT